MIIKCEINQLQLNGMILQVLLTGDLLVCSPPKTKTDAWRFHDSTPGFPDKFVRYSGGRRLFVHSRKDDPEVEFKAEGLGGGEGPSSHGILRAMPPAPVKYFPFFKKNIQGQ